MEHTAFLGKYNYSNEKNDSSELPFSDQRLNGSQLSMEKMFPFLSAP